MSSISSRALAEAITSSVRYPRWSFGRSGSTIDVAALALPAARSSRYSRTLASGVRAQFATVTPTTATTARITQATTASAMRLMRRLLLADIGVKDTPVCGACAAP